MYPMKKFSIREQLLIFSMSLILVASLALWGIREINKNENKLKIQRAKLEDQIKQIRYLSSEWSQLQQKLTAPIMLQSLSTFVENIARSIGIQDNLQLNVLTNVKLGTEGIKVGLDRLKLDHLILLLYKLENHRPVLKISHLSISISPGERRIRASFQVHKQKEG